MSGASFSELVVTEPPTRNATFADQRSKPFDCMFSHSVDSDA